MTYYQRCTATHQFADDRLGDMRQCVLSTGHRDHGSTLIETHHDGRGRWWSTGRAERPTAAAPATRLVLYIAHPLGATDRAGLDANLRRAMRWLAWLRRAFPETTFIAPWIAAVLAGEDDADPAQREAGLVDACAVITRCDGVVLVGGRVSSGMSREIAACPWGGWDLTRLGDEPPPVGVTGLERGFLAVFGSHRSVA